jgi:hypothetical protein
MPGAVLLSRGFGYAGWSGSAGNEGAAAEP